MHRLSFQNDRKVGWGFTPNVVDLRNMLVKISLPRREGLREGEKTVIRYRASVLSPSPNLSHPVFAKAAPRQARERSLSFFRQSNNNSIVGADLCVCPAMVARYLKYRTETHRSAPTLFLHTVVHFIKSYNFIHPDRAFIFPSFNIARLPFK